jgi:hypothetical protein
MARAKRKTAPPQKPVQQQQMEAQGMPPDMAGAYAGAPSMKRGGRVPKTGTYTLHKGEKVVPAKKGKR